MNKSIGILSKFVTNQHQLIIKGKIPKEVWKVLQERFQYINPISISRFIHEATTKKLSDFRDIYKYTGSY